MALTDTLLRLAGYTTEAERAYANGQPPKGESGVDTVGGTTSPYDPNYIGGADPNNLLDGVSKYDVYREMFLTDPAVRSVELMFALTIRSAVWSIEPVTDEPEDREVAAACAYQLGLPWADEPGTDSWLDQTWDESLSQALLYLRNGAMFEELVWGKPIDWLNGESGLERRIVPIVRLAPRHPASIEELDADGKTLRKIKQFDLGTNDQAKPIAGEKLVYYISDQEEAGWFGTSFLRPMFGPWKLKKQLQVAAAIGWDRFAAGIPKVRYPSGSSQQNEQKAQQIGRNLRLHERGWIALEGTVEEGWDVEILSGAHTLPDPIPLLRHFDEQIATAGLQGFTRLGVTETGSRAVGEVLADPYYLAAQSIANYIADQRQKLVLRRFVDYNFGTDVELPEITVSKITRRSPNEVIQAIADLSGVGFNLKYPELIEHLLAMLELPDLPDDHPLEEEGAGLPPPPGEEPPPEEEIPPEQAEEEVTA